MNNWIKIEFDDTEYDYIWDRVYDSFNFRPSICPEDWPIPLFPCGDYYLFLPKDFRWGILTHPWERSICIFGQDLIKSFDKNKPVLFSKVLRSSL